MFAKFLFLSKITIATDIQENYLPIIRKRKEGNESLPLYANFLSEEPLANSTISSYLNTDRNEATLGWKIMEKRVEKDGKYNLLSS